MEVSSPFNQATAALPDAEIETFTLSPEKFEMFNAMEDRDLSNLTIILSQWLFFKSLVAYFIFIISSCHSCYQLIFVYGNLYITILYLYSLQKNLIY